MLTCRVDRWEEEGCPFGQQAETGQHRSLDVPTPPFTGAGAHNVVEQGPSCRCRGTTPCTSPRTYPFPPIPSGTYPPPPHPPFSCPCLVSKLRHVPCLYYTLSSHTSLSRLTSRTRLAAWPVNRCDSIICPKSSVHFAPRIFSKRLCDNLLPTSYLPAHTKLSQHVYTKNAQEADSAYTCRVGKREAPGDSEEYRVAGGVTEYQGRQRHRGASGWREGAAPA